MGRIDVEAFDMADTAQRRDLTIAVLAGLDMSTRNAARTSILANYTRDSFFCLDTVSFLVG